MTLHHRPQEKEIELRKKMRRLKIFEKDIKEDFVRSQGPGGQNVNKVSTCVNLVHLPTGVKVKCQTERTQKANRVKARLLLVQKIEKVQKAAEQKVIATREKKRRQNRKKPKALKEKILEEKGRQSTKKESRRKIKPHKLDKYL